MLVIEKRILALLLWRLICLSIFHYVAELAMLQIKCSDFAIICNRGYGCNEPYRLISCDYPADKLSEVRLCFN